MTTGKRAAVRLQPGRERSLRQGHPWVLSGSVAEVVGDPAPGDWVQVRDAHGELLGAGDFDPESQIRVRMAWLGEPRPDWDDESWFEERLVGALAWRAAHPLLQGSDALRLVHAEADGLPGLTIDRYGPWLVVRPGSPAMLRRVDRYAELLRRWTGAQGAWLRGDVQRPLEARQLFGSAVPAEPVPISEHGRSYFVDLQRGQKTGFYLDQRDSRSLLGRLARGQRVLDLFAYSGGFAAAALAGGATSVLAVESSPAACALARKNAPAAELYEGDVRQFLRAHEDRFDLIALDPPALAKRSRDVPAASRAYKDLNLWALRRAAPGAHLLTFSCSHHLDAALFQKIVAGAARDARRSVQILARLGAPPDHPVAAHHPESEYLKGLLLRVHGGS
jgi:23S rRNA (cytosine1962-C5)-methyltransferase